MPVAGWREDEIEEDGDNDAEDQFDADRQGVEDEEGTHWVTAARR
jgi:hypothetical protein